MGANNLKGSFVGTTGYKRIQKMTADSKKYCIDSEGNYVPDTDANAYSGSFPSVYGWDSVYYSHNFDKELWGICKDEIEDMFKKDIEVDIKSAIENDNKADVLRWMFARYNATMKDYSGVILQGRREAFMSFTLIFERMSSIPNKYSGYVPKKGFALFTVDPITREKYLKKYSSLGEAKKDAFKFLQDNVGYYNLGINHLTLCTEYPDLDENVAYIFSPGGCYKCYLSAQKVKSYDDSTDTVFVEPVYRFYYVARAHE